MRHYLSAFLCKIIEVHIKLKKLGKSNSSSHLSKMEKSGFPSSLYKWVYLLSSQTNSFSKGKQNHKGWEILKANIIICFRGFQPLVKFRYSEKAKIYF